MGRVSASSSAISSRTARCLQSTSKPASSVGGFKFSPCIS
jgi:hypothetical protein